MIRKILLVDDDKILLNILRKNFKKYEDQFSVLTAGNGLEAIEKLKTNIFSVIVTDLEMPEMDGFDLLAHVSENYPDVPAIILTGTNLIKSKRQTLEDEYDGFIQKPPNFEDLLEQIQIIFKKQSEGGILRSFSLETFVQLVELGQKTCTLRVFNKSSHQEGLLFFDDGELMDARLSDISGKQAAYEIISWDRMVVEIQNVCPVKERRIDEDLSFIVLEAMRLKDEASIEESDTEEPIESDIDRIINIAETYRGHGLYKETAKIYKSALSKKDELDPEDRKKINEKIRSFKNEIDIHKDSKETEIRSGINTVRTYLSLGSFKDAQEAYEKMVADIEITDLDPDIQQSLKELSFKLPKIM